MRDAGHVLAGKVKQYIFISTISVYAANDEPNADETAALVPYPGKDAYAETSETMRSTPVLYGSLKALSEQQAEMLFPGMATIIRPGLIVGPGDETDRFTYWPVRIDRGGEVLAPGDGADPVQYIDARDLAEWTIRMAEQGMTGVFNATGPARKETMRQMLDGVGAGAARRRPLHLGPRHVPRRQQGLAWSICRCGSAAVATPPASPDAASPAPTRPGSPTARWP